VNVSAPNSASDLTGLVLPQALTDVGKQISGFAPGQSLPTGAGTLDCFQATLESLLPADSEAADKPPKDPKKDEGKDLITGVPVPVPVQAPEVLPLRLGIPIPQIQAVDSVKPPTLTATSVRCNSASKKAGAVEPAIPTALVEADPELPPAPAPAIPFVVPQGPELAGHASREPLAVAAERPARGLPEPVDVTPAARIPAAQMDTSAADLPYLAFTERLSATDRATDQATDRSGASAPSIAGALHGLPPADARTEPAEPRQAEPTPAADKNRVAPAAGTDGSHSSEHRSADEDRSHASGQSADPVAHIDAEGNRASAHQELSVPAPTPVRAAANIQQPAPDPKPAEVSQSDIEATGPQPTPAAHSSEARTISLRLADTGEQQIDLKVTDRGGDVKVAVRTADVDLAGSLRDNLGDLVHKLEQSGFRAESWHSAQPSSPTAGHRDPQSDGESFHGQDQRQDQHQAGDGRQRKQQERDRIHWMQEIEPNTTPDSERNMPTWLPSSTR
jgi:hypothetical protein